MLAQKWINLFLKMRNYSFSSGGYLLFALHLINNVHQHIFCFFSPTSSLSALNEPLTIFSWKHFYSIFDSSSRIFILLSWDTSAKQLFQIEWDILIIFPPLFIPIHLKYRFCAGRWNSVNLSPSFGMETSQSFWNAYGGSSTDGYLALAI